MKRRGFYMALWMVALALAGAPEWSMAAGSAFGSHKTISRDRCKKTSAYKIDVKTLDGMGAAPAATAQSEGDRMLG